MKIETLEKSLQEKFGLASFRLGQREIIQSVIDGRDVLGIMPTGGGKSLCYQLPAVLRPGITVVVSPLISLMNDQVRALRQLGLPAGCVHSGVSVDERKSIFQDMTRQASYLLYVSPERVQKPGFAAWLEKQRINIFAIDEAHCVSQWGHDFRPEYSQITTLRQLRPEVPVVALTATATPYVKRDIITHLGLNSPAQHVYGFYRPNLYYQVEFCADEEEKESFVWQALEQTPVGRIIIYCGTRKKTEEWASALGRSEKVAFYHAGLSAAERIKVEEEYQSGEVRILAATNAFGMGIDHPDVRLVIHTQMPGNVESYYQEVGRAGRDGQPSTCLLLYSRKDKGLQSFFIRGSKAPEEIIRHRWQALDAIVQYSEGAECRHGDILTYFKDQQRLKSCGHCDSCAPEAAPRIRRRPRAFGSKVKKRREKKSALVMTDLQPDAKWRVEVLREWRKEYAQEHDIPAFMVFSDKTLRDLAARAPRSKEGLAKVYGLGEKKISVFGDILLEKLRSE